MRKIILTLLLLILGIIAALLLGEISMRLLGYRPFTVPYGMKKIVPLKAYKNDVEKGIALNPGSYTYYYVNGYQFTATHTPEGLRKTTYWNKNPNDSVKGKILIFGDSFMYGMGLPDSQTCASQLQLMLPTYQVYNYGVLGYSAIMQYITFKNALLQHKNIAAVVFQYADYDKERICYTARFRKALSVNSNLKVRYKYLYARYKWGHFSYGEIPSSLDKLSRYSAMVNQFTEKLNLLELERFNASNLRNDLWKEMLLLANKNNIKTVVLDIGSSGDSTVENFSTAFAVKWINIPFDIELKGKTLMPFDNHPNATLQKEYATTIKGAINEK